MNAQASIPRGANLARAVGWTVLVYLIASPVALAIASGSSVSNSRTGVFILAGLIALGVLAAARSYDADWQAWVLAFFGPLGLAIALWRAGNRRDKKRLTGTT